MLIPIMPALNRHAPLSGAARHRCDNVGRRLSHIRIRQHDQMIFRSTHCQNPLQMTRPSPINAFGHGRGTDKRDGADSRMITDGFEDRLAVFLMNQLRQFVAMAQQEFALAKKDLHTFAAIGNHVQYSVRLPNAH